MKNNRSTWTNCILTVIWGRLVVFDFSYVVATQSSVGPITPKPGRTIRQPLQTSIRRNVELVSMALVVHSGKGSLVMDLDKKEFRTFANRVEQRAEDIETAAVPISAVLVVETRSRIQALLPGIRRTEILFTQAVLGADRDAVIPLGTQTLAFGKKKAELPRAPH